MSSPPLEPLYRFQPFCSHRQIPWANGLGTSHEIIRILRDPSREQLSLPWVRRVALAPVVEPGPFSHYPGVDRQLVVVAGVGGMSLRFGDESSSVSSSSSSSVASFGTVVSFSGDVPTSASSVGTGVWDLGVMSFRGETGLDGTSTSTSCSSCCEMASPPRLVILPAGSSLPRGHGANVLVAIRSAEENNGGEHASGRSENAVGALRIVDGEVVAVLEFSELDAVIVGEDKAARGREPAIVIIRGTFACVYDLF